MVKILIVEDDVQLATTLKYLVEDNPRYRVVATATADSLPPIVVVVLMQRWFVKGLVEMEK